MGKNEGLASIKKTVRNTTGLPLPTNRLGTKTRAAKSD
jgi:hypothetical protein